MKTYLVMSANKTEFMETCKRFNVKCEKLACYIKSIPIYAFRTKKEAIKECRHHNNFKAETEFDFLMTYDKVHYIKEISIY